MDGESIYFRLINRNKKSVSINLKDPRGVEGFKQLARGADILIEGFRPGVLTRLGAGYEQIAEVNPRILYCSLTGYGQDGPLRDHPGHDLNYEARPGVLSLMRTEDGCPVLPPVQIADLTGAMTAVISLLAALVARDRGGSGRYIDVSMHESSLHWTIFAQCEERAEDHIPGQGRSILSGRFAFYGVYRARDGHLLSVALPEIRFWENFCEAIGRPDFTDRFIEEPSDRLRREIGDVLGTKTAQEWMGVFAGRDICVDPVLDVRELRIDPHILHRHVFARLPAREKELWCQLFPARITGFQPEAGRAPHLGEHTDEILGALPTIDLAALRARGVI